MIWESFNTTFTKHYDQYIWIDPKLAAISHGIIQIKPLDSRPLHLTYFHSSHTSITRG